MPFTQELSEELNLILKFPSQSMMQGLKVHSDADHDVAKAMHRLYQKGIVTQEDGGYLTDLGFEIHAHAEQVAAALSSK